MKSFIAPGKTVTLTAPYAVMPGQGLRVGAFFGVASAAAAVGEPVDVALEGVFDLAKAPSQAWQPGDRIFWDDAARLTTRSSGGTTLIGVAIEPVGGGAGDVVGRVRLNGGIAGGVYGLPAGLGWTRAPVEATRSGSGYEVNLSPRALVDPAIWTGAAIHVDGVAGLDTNSGLGSVDGDFSAAKRTIHAAFTAGNATGAPYRVIVKPGNFENSAFTNNGTVEPTRPVAIIGWNGRVNYRAGLRTQSWTLDQGTTYTATITSVMRLLRADVLTPEGLYTELTLAASLAACRATIGTWFKDVGDVLYVNLGKVVTTTDVVVIRGFHGARFLTHASDLYLENLDIEGGITGALHCDAIATRTIVGVNCTFRYSSPSTSGPVPLDAVQIRRTNGLVAFFDCDASSGAKDGWNFHADGTSGMHALLVNCTGWRNGAMAGPSNNAVTSHDDVIMAVIGGRFGLSRNGTDIHCIEDTKTFIIGVEVIARDPDGTCTAFKCSNNGRMWLQDTVADAAGGLTANYGIEANDGGIVWRRGHWNRAGTNLAFNGGQILDF
jgi:predicted RecA/RadA family phage recombinase